MTKTLKTILLCCDLAALIITSIWYYNTRDLEPLAGIFICLGGLLGLIFTKEKPSKSKKKLPTMSQNLGDNSEGYQSYGDMTINKRP